MKTDESEMEYNIRTLQSMIYDQATRYFKFSKSHVEDEFATDAAELANKCAYNINIAGSIQKTFKQEKRLKSIEEKLKNTQLPTNMRMFEAPLLEKYR